MGPVGLPWADHTYLFGFAIFHQLHIRLGTGMETQGMEAGDGWADSESGSHPTTRRGVDAALASPPCARSPDRLWTGGPWEQLGGSGGRRRCERSTCIQGSGAGQASGNNRACYGSGSRSRSMSRSWSQNCICCQRYSELVFLENRKERGRVLQRALYPRLPQTKGLIAQMETWP